MTAKEYITNLARSFPCLQGKFSWSPEHWDAVHVEKISRNWSSGERLCILFVLAVWAGKNGDYPAFDVVDAMATLTSANRLPIIDWITSPYWP